jgi:hypothetical protein
VTAPVRNSWLWPIKPKSTGWVCWRSDNPATVPVKYRGHWARLDDAGHVHLLLPREVRNELGHLSIGG